MKIVPGSNLNDVIAAAYRLHADIVAAGDAITEPFGLSAARWQVLGAIALGSDVTVADLARTIGTTRQSVQRIVSELVGENLLSLDNNPRHRRAKLLRMTVRGRNAYDEVIAIWTPHAARLEQQVGQETARDLANKMADIAEAFRTVAAQRGGVKPTSTSQEEQKK